MLFKTLSLFRMHLKIKCFEILLQGISRDTMPMLVFLSWICHEDRDAQLMDSLVAYFFNFTFKIKKVRSQEKNAF